MKKIVAILLLYIIVFPSSVLADGGVWYYYQDRWEPLTENEQKAAINYQDGLQKMIISVNFDLGADDKAVWIFPVPSKPEKVVIDVVTKFPMLYGRNPITEAKSSVGMILLVGSMTQIYPILLGLPLIFFVGTFAGTRAVSDTAAGGVTVHEHIEKEGLITEIITAETGDALYNYLVNQGLGIQRNAISIFDVYIGKEYSFVVSWVSSSGVTNSQCVKTEVCCYSQRTGKHYWRDSCDTLPYETYGTVTQVSTITCESWTTCYQRCTSGSSTSGGLNYRCGVVRDNYCCCLNDADSCSSVPTRTYVSPYQYPSGRQPGVFITFPTDKIYYPLLPTSIYGSTKIPITIYVLDHVEPETYNDIKSYVKSDYFIANYPSTTNLESFYGNMNTRNMKYTKIQILDAPSKYFTDDLWFRMGAPLNVGFASFVYYAISGNPLVAGIIIILLLSALTGAVTGFLVFKNWKKYALIGLTNIFSIIGLIIAILLTKSEQKISEDLKRRMKKEGVSVMDKRKYRFIPIFSILYLGISFFVFILISLL